MVLKIFLDDKSFHCLKQSIPPGSHSKLVLEEAVHLKFFGSNTVISCDETEARNLLLYAAIAVVWLAQFRRRLFPPG